MILDRLLKHLKPETPAERRSKIAAQRRALIAEINSAPSPPAAGEEPILAELAAAGYEVGSLADLRNSGVRYRGAIPVLLRGLPSIIGPELGEELVRTLSVPWAKPAAARPLIELFKRVGPEASEGGLGLGWTIGNALEIVGDDSVFDQLTELAQDRRYGRAREMIVLGLGKSKKPEAVPILIELAGDPDVDGHAIAALAKLRAPAAKHVFEAKLEDRRAWVRKEARKGLAKLSPLP